MKIAGTVYCSAHFTHACTRDVCRVSTSKFLSEKNRFVSLSKKWSENDFYTSWKGSFLTQAAAETEQPTNHLQWQIRRQSEVLYRKLLQKPVKVIRFRHQNTEMLTFKFIWNFSDEFEFHLWLLSMIFDVSGLSLTFRFSDFSASSLVRNDLWLFWNISNLLWMLHHKHFSAVPHLSFFSVELDCLMTQRDLEWHTYFPLF